MNMTPVIETHDLRKVYQMGETEVQALKGVSITVNEGEMVSIMGPSGSGKSTLMALLGALDTPTSGEYLLDGEAVSQLPESKLSDIRNQRIGFVFQKFNLLSNMSTLDNVALPLIYAGMDVSERRERAQAALETVGLGDRVKHKPTELSGGQQQRVAIARALVSNPSIIMADEPTGNLDTETGDEIMELFKDLHRKEGITLVIVTHDPEIMVQTERCIYLRDGLLQDLPESLTRLWDEQHIANGRSSNGEKASDEPASDVTIIDEARENEAAANNEAVHEEEVTK